MCPAQGAQQEFITAAIRAAVIFVLASGLGRSRPWRGRHALHHRVWHLILCVNVVTRTRIKYWLLLKPKEGSNLTEI